MKKVDCDFQECFHTNTELLQNSEQILLLKHSCAHVERVENILTLKAFI